MHGNRILTLTPPRRGACLDPHPVRDASAVASGIEAAVKIMNEKGSMKKTPKGGGHGRDGATSTSASVAFRRLGAGPCISCYGLLRHEAI